MSDPKDKTPPVEAPVEHHVWCNFWTRPVEDCWMCRNLWENYPYDSEEEQAGLMGKHFPQNVRRT